MNKLILFILTSFLALSCRPSQTQEAAAESGIDSTAVGEDANSASALKPGFLPGQIVDRPLVIDPADFQARSAARELAQVLAGGAPAGKSVRLNFMTFEKGSVVFPDEGAAAREVDELAVILRENPGLFVEVAAFAGGGGGSERLAIQRAFFIKNRLIEDMVDPERIDTKGLAADGTGERVEVRVLRN